MNKTILLLTIVLITTVGCQSASTSTLPTSMPISTPILATPTAIPPPTLPISPTATTGLTSTVTPAATSAPTPSVSITFSPESNSFAEDTREYQTIWDNDGNRIIETMEGISGLRFAPRNMRAIVYGGLSDSGLGDAPMLLRANFPTSQKKALLILLLGNRLIAPITIPKDLDTSKILCLILYDVWEKLYGKSFADEAIVFDKTLASGRRVPAWNWTLVLSPEERKTLLREVSQQNPTSLTPSPLFLLTPIPSGVPTVASAAQQPSVSMVFVPESQVFAYATAEYQSIWNSEGKRIVETYERISGLKFTKTTIQVIVSLDRSESGLGDTPMRLNATLAPNVKRSTLIHELGHRLDTHKALFLILYDVWADLYGATFADNAVQASRAGSQDYDLAWTWALSFSAEQRASQFRDWVTRSKTQK